MGATLSVLLGHLIAVAPLLWSRGSRAQAPLWCMGLVAPWPVGHSQTRDRTRVPCIGRQILCHWATGEVPKLCLKSSPRHVWWSKPDKECGSTWCGGRRLEWTNRPSHSGPQSWFQTASTFQVLLCNSSHHTVWTHLWDFGF